MGKSSTYVPYAAPWFMNARASRPICVPVAVQRERLKEQEEVMGRGKLEANGTVGLYCTRDMPWQASLHQL
jgi:hypothetical protein